MKIQEYEVLRDARDAIARTVAQDIADMLREHVDLMGERLIRERYQLDGRHCDVCRRLIPAYRQEHYRDGTCSVR